MPDQERHTYYRCGFCNLNLVPIPKFVRCPVCLGPTAIFSRPGIKILTERETDAVARHMLFEMLYGNDTEDVIELRLAHALEIVAERTKRLFDSIIAEGGFSDEECVRIIHLEAQLPGAHQ